MTRLDKPLVAVLGVSHKDVQLAIEWLRWASFLHKQFAGKRDTVINVMLTQSITDEEVQALDAAADLPVWFLRLGDSHEVGYPGSANHLFLRSLEYCEAEHPGSPVLWIEADAIPVRPGWLQAIASEYATCGKAFLGHLEDEHYTPHLAGVAVYPPDWRQRAPRLASVLSSPDVKAFGKGRGTPFDTYAGRQTIAQAARSHTIQQVWQCPPITADNLHLVNECTALFHQCKTGALITALRATRYASAPAR